MKIFFSLPFTANLDETGIFKRDRKEFYGNLIDYLSERHDIYSAPTNEDWGNIKLPTKKFTSYDVDSIVNCDCLVVVSSERISRDIYLEIGIAIGLNKSIYMFIPESTPVTFMILGSIELGKINLFRYAEEKEVLSLLKSAVI